MSKYKVKYKVDQFFDVEVEIDNPPKTQEELSDAIYRLITDDYRVGNMNNEEIAESYSIEMIEEIK